MGDSTSTMRVMDALARFRVADADMHHRVRTTASLGENELRILGFLLREHRAGRVVKPSEISRHIGVSSASTTALLDRLERQGSVERVSHPTDRRSILIAPTAQAEQEVADLVDAFDQRVRQIADAFDEDGRTAVLSFLEAVTEATESIAAPDATRSYSLA